VIAERNAKEINPLDREIPLVLLGLAEASTEACLLAAEGRFQVTSVSSVEELALSASTHRNLLIVAPARSLGGASARLWLRVFKHAPNAWLIPFRHDDDTADIASALQRRVLGVASLKMGADDWGMLLAAAFNVMSAFRGAHARIAALDEELSSFTYRVTHDLRGPLQGVVGLSGLLMELEGSRLTEEGREILSRIDQSGEYVASLVSSLNQLSRIFRRAPETRRIDMNELISALFAEVSHDLSCAIETSQCPQPLPVVNSDEELLSDLIRRLLDNAVRHNPTAGLRVSVAATLLAAPEADDATLRVSVTDSGVGIDAAYHERVFEIFTRLDDEGPGVTGMGLAIVDHTARRLGGRAWVVSESGKGCATYFELKVEAAPR